MIIHDGTNARKISYADLFTKVYSGSTSLSADGSQLNLTGSIIPTTNSQFDLGSAEFKIRHLYLSNNSLFLGDTSVTESDYLNKTTLSENPVPVSANEPGTKGEIRYNDTHIYICIIENVWVRASIQSAW
jgi:hypothetical protein